MREDGPLALLAGLAQVLAEAFLDPEADLAEALADLGEAGPGPTLGAPLRRMAEHPLSAEARAVEYARLFLHARDTAPVHLVESVQAHGQHLAPEVLEPLLALHDAADLRLQAGLNLPPDHLGLELACLGHLLDQAREDRPEAPGSALLARRLIRDHLRPFVAAVARQLPQARPHPAFEAAVDLASALLPEAEKALVEI